jgi:hypothetical protein
MRVMWTAYTVLYGSLQIPLGRSKYRLEGNIEMNLTEIHRLDVQLIHLA